MAVEYEISEQTLIPNTITEKGLINGIHQIYRFTSNDGYVLHDNAADWDDGFGNITIRFSSGTCSCGANYDFATTEKTVTDINGNSVTVTAYGSREFFAFPRNLVADPKSNIYGVGDNNHEVM